jgi:hypothetical protein
MKKSATEVMQEILFAAAIDAIVALKGASKGLPNNLLRDLGAIHANTTFADLPAELRAAISNGVRAAFARLLREGYSVGEGSAPPRPLRPAGPPGNQHRPFRRPPSKRDGPGPGRPPGKSGGRPPRKPTPR